LQKSGDGGNLLLWDSMRLHFSRVELL